MSEMIHNHPHMAKAVLAQMPAEEKLIEAAELFKAFSDPGRLKMITALSLAELCVCDLCDIVSMNQSAVSHQLRYLAAIGVIRRRKEGRYVFYSLKDSHIISIFMQGLAHTDCLESEQKEGGNRHA